LHMAARSGGAEIIKELLSAGADASRTEPSGLVPRQIAEKNPRSVKAGCAELLKEAESMGK